MQIFDLCRGSAPLTPVFFKNQLCRIKQIIIVITESDGKIRIAFSGDGFLQNMVRIMAGTLIEVGLGKRDASSMTAILEAKSREVAGMMAPPEGLFLKEVRY